MTDPADCTHTEYLSLRTNSGEVLRVGETNFERVGWCLRCGSIVELRKAKLPKTIVAPSDGATVADDDEEDE